MGQKVSPLAVRLNIQDTWKSRWFADKKTYKRFLLDDIKLRSALMKKLHIAGISHVEIERSLKNLKIFVHVTRPGIVIGRGGTGMEDLKKFVIKTLDPTGKLATQGPKIDIRVEEIKNPDLSAFLVANRIAEQLARRMPYRRVVNKTMEKVIQSGALGVKVMLAGRINGAEISRKEKFFIGSIPLQTLRANIDFAKVPSLTRSGYIGCKVWIYKAAVKS